MPNIARGLNLLLLALRIALRVDDNVAYLDLGDVVHEQYFDDVGDVYTFACV